MAATFQVRHHGADLKVGSCTDRTHAPNIPVWARSVGGHPVTPGRVSHMPGPVAVFPGLLQPIYYNGRKKLSMTPEAAVLRSALEERLGFERLIADLASTFVHLPEGNVAVAIENAQRRICETLDIDRSTVTQFTGPHEQPVFTHGWAREGLVRVSLASEGVADMFPWSTQRIRAGQTVQFSSVDELPPEAAADNDAFRRIGTKSNLTLPLVVGDTPLGALSFGSTPVVNAVGLATSSIDSG